MKKKVIITGVKGFLGKKVAEFLKKDFDIYGIDIEDSDEGGVRTYSSRDLSVLGIHPDFVVICHAAVSSGIQTVEKNLLYKVNVQLTDEIVNKFEKAKIVYISTASVFKNSDQVTTENSEVCPKNDYSISKFWAENIVASKSNSLIIRPTSLYGIGMKENTLIPNYINQALISRKILVWGDGRRVQNYLHVNDMCCLIKKVLNYDIFTSNRILLAAHCKGYSNIEIAKIVAYKTGAIIEYTRVDESPSHHYLNAETQKLFDWEPQMDVENEINNYILWKQKQF